MAGMIYCIGKINVGLNVHEEEQMLSLSLRVLDSISSILVHICSWAIHSDTIHVSSLCETHKPWSLPIQNTW